MKISIAGKANHLPATARKTASVLIGGILGVLLAAATALGQAVSPEVPPADIVPPSVVYGALYRDVELQRIFPDSKTFPDLIPDAPPSDIVAEYAASKDQPGFDLTGFVTRHFTGPTPPGPSVSPARDGTTLPAYISQVWPVLEQSARTVPAYSTLQPLPEPYVVPGGRFREIYYWDTYFTMLGLELDRRHDTARGMLQNFGFELDRYGRIPNGNRSYYLSRSQPPFFSLMVDLIAARDGDAIYRQYLPELKAEYAFWMQGAERLAPGSAHRRVVRLPDGSLLNRYWDDRPVPRDESYYEDVNTAATSNRPPREVWRNLRSAAESGWDFSSRWFADGQTLATIRTTSLLPVDLNALLAHLELTIARALHIQGDAEAAATYRHAAYRRTHAIHELMWNAKLGAFTDYLWQEWRPSHALTAATLYPLFVGIATPAQVADVAATVERALLMPGGMATTLVTSGQQWDAPNGWAPLQWIAVIGLRRYGETRLAEAIAERWVRKNIAGYEQTGKLVEKYNVMTTGGDEGGGGEYATQIGFGWTNGVLTGLAALYPRLAAEVAAAVPMQQAAPSAALP